MSDSWCRKAGHEITNDKGVATPLAFSRWDGQDESGNVSRDDNAELGFLKLNASLFNGLDPLPWVWRGADEGGEVSRNTI
ncbi:MAG: hypothetical protein IPL78_19255 [Chloroflexi bacterium]|nr:hypothetical protein [Chloroflexota bacterium]